MLDTPSPRGEGGGPVPAAPAPCLTLENISKRFPGVVPSTTQPQPLPG